MKAKHSPIIINLNSSFESKFNESEVHLEDNSMENENGCISEMEIIKLSKNLDIGKNKYSAKENSKESFLLKKKKRMNDTDIEILKEDELRKPRHKRKRSEESLILEQDIVAEGSLKEKSFEELAIDDPLVVDKYLDYSNFTPLNVLIFIKAKILNTYKTHNPKVDVRESSYSRNDGVKYEKLNNNTYTKIVIQSEEMNIRTECSSDTKIKARQYCAQKFLRVILLFLISY
jgi:hypothetical protein